jgi:hypothetical protein
VAPAQPPSEAAAAASSTARRRSGTEASEVIETIASGSCRHRASPAKRVARAPSSVAVQKAGASAQSPGRRLRRAEGGDAFSFAAGLIGRRTSSPPQFGHSPPASRVRAQSAHHVHSKEQIIAS